MGRVDHCRCWWARPTETQSVALKCAAPLSLQVGAAHLALCLVLVWPSLGALEPFCPVDSQSGTDRGGYYYCFSQVVGVL